MPPRSNETADIYLTAREMNARTGISGYLHQEDGHFVQFVEGPAWSIQAILQTIAKDPRHTSMAHLLSFESQHRMFRDWEMAFTDEETRRYRKWFRGAGYGASISCASSEQLFDFMLDRSALEMFKTSRAEQEIA